MTSPVETFDFGIGAQVYIEAVSTDDPSPWPEEPSGIIVGTGGAAIQRVTNSGGPSRLWTVQFDSPQIHIDGTTGHTSAQVHEKYLHLAPPYVEEPSFSEA